MMQTDRIEHCPVCGSPGTLVTSSAVDLVFGVPGSWSYLRCNQATCRTIFLGSRFREEDVPALYQTYYTHTPVAGETAAPGLARRIYEGAKAAWLYQRFGYPISSWWTIPLGWLNALHPGGFAAVNAHVFHLAFPKVGDGRSKPLLLEVGCGSGEHLHRMRSFGWDVEGTEIDTACVTACNAAGLKVRQGTLALLSLESERYDAIILNHVLEHVVDPVQELARCRDLLVPGGKVCVVTPNGMSTAARLEPAVWRGLEPPRHFCILNRSALPLAARQAGLEVLSCVDRISANAFFRWQTSAIRAAKANGRAMATFGHGIRMSDWIWQYLSRLLRLVRPTIGEETVLIAYKSR